MLVRSLSGPTAHTKPLQGLAFLLAPLFLKAEYYMAIESVEDISNETPSEEPAVKAVKERKVKDAVKVIPERPKRYFVDEARDFAVSVGYSTVVFRPGQRLDSDHLINLAKQNGVAIREV